MPKGKEKAVSEADLIKAIKQNKPAAMSKLLKSGGNPNTMIMPAENKPGDPYREPLIVCAAQILASGIMLTTLIKAKADVDKQDSVGGTALMAAATVAQTLVALRWYRPECSQPMRARPAKLPHGSLAQLAMARFEATCQRTLQWQRLQSSPKPMKWQQGERQHTMLPFRQTADWALL